MKNKFNDEVVDEVRKSRKKLLKRIKKEPQKFKRDVESSMKRLGLKYSNIKSIEIDFSKLSHSKKRSDDEAA
jgi:hypothetical protein